MPPGSAKKKDVHYVQGPYINYDGDFNENLTEKKESASFEAISRLSQVAQLLERREFMLEL